VRLEPKIQSQQRDARFASQANLINRVSREMQHLSQEALLIAVRYPRTLFQGDRNCYSLGPKSILFRTRLG
jgi:hypothetical protein